MSVLLFSPARKGLLVFISGECRLSWRDSGSEEAFHQPFHMLANYTCSKAIDDSTDFNSDYAAFNEVNLAAVVVSPARQEPHSIQRLSA